MFGFFENCYIYFGMLECWWWIVESQGLGSSRSREVDPFLCFRNHSVFVPSLFLYLKGLPCLVLMTNALWLPPSWWSASRNWLASILKHVPANMDPQQYAFITNRPTEDTFTFMAFIRHFCPKPLPVTYTNPYTVGGGCHARCWLAHHEQFGFQYLAQRHFNMQTRGIKPATHYWQQNKWVSVLRVHIIQILLRNQGMITGL